MKDIFLTVKSHWIFDFNDGNNSIFAKKELKCSYCDTIPLDRIYAYIIENLREADLLPEDYKPICCYCYVLEKFGLLDLVENVEFFRYNKAKDIFRIYLSFRDDNGAIKDVYFYIHDYSKWA